MGMGVLPLEFKPGESSGSLGLTGRETFDIDGSGGELRPRQELRVIATASDGSCQQFGVIARLDSLVDVEYYRNGGILQTVLRGLAAAP